MDSASHPTNVVMETGSVLMAVMNSTAVSSVPTLKIQVLNVCYLYPYRFSMSWVDMQQWTMYLILPTL